MRHPRIPAGAAVAAIAVAVSTTSAFAVAGKVPLPVAFQTASASHTEPAAAPTSTPEPRTGEPRRPRPPARESAKVEPPRGDQATSPTTVLPAPVPHVDGDHHEAPSTTTPSSTTPAPAAPAPGEAPPTTALPRIDEPKPTTTTAPAPTTSTTAPARSGEEHPLTLPALSLTCSTGVISGVPTGKCSWSSTDLAAFVSWRFFRTTSTGAGQILFTGTDRTATSYVVQPLTVGQSQTYAIQALDATGRPIASSAPVTVTCCGSQTGQK